MRAKTDTTRCRIFISERRSGSRPESGRLLGSTPLAVERSNVRTHRCGTLRKACREGIPARQSLELVLEHSRTRVATTPVAAGSNSFAAIYDLHVDEVYRFVHRRCRDHSLSEDITQETFMAAIRNTDDPSSISIGWLITVARNRLFDELRRRSRYEDRLRLLGAPETSDDAAEMAERLRIESALSELSVDHRLVLTLRYIDGFTVPALAEHLGRSVKSVEGLVTRARRELRAQLDATSVADVGRNYG